MVPFSTAASFIRSPSDLPRERPTGAATLPSSHTPTRRSAGAMMTRLSTSSLRRSYG